jgi:large subunit ribosomal protein LP2
MKLLAAYILLVLGGKSSPTADEITNLITTVGGEVDADALTAMLADLEGKDINELLAKGEKDLSSVVGVAVASSGAAGKLLRLNLMNMHEISLLH